MLVLNSVPINICLIIRINLTHLLTVNITMNKIYKIHKLYNFRFHTYTFCNILTSVIEKAKIFSEIKWMYLAGNLPGT